MKLIIAKADLSRLITGVGKVVEARTTIPILSSVLLTATADTLTIKGTDLDIEATASVAVQAEPGSICVDAKLLAGIVAKASGDISLSVEGDKLIVKSGRSRFSLQTLPASDFPDMAGGKFDAMFDIDLASLFAPVAFAISTEATRFYLNGIYMHLHEGDLRAVATDGHRLSRHHVTYEGDGAFDGVIVPRKTVSVLPKGVVNVSVSQQKIHIETEGFTLTSKLIDGTFPDYPRVIPVSNDKIVTFGSDDMRQAAGRVSVIASERGRAVRLSFTEGQAVLTVNNPDQGEATEEIFVGYDGDPVEIGFNAAYLNDLVSIFPAGDIKLALADSGSPALFTSEKAENLLAVLMPMRV